MTTEQNSAGETEVRQYNLLQITADVEHGPDGVGVPTMVHLRSQMEDITNSYYVSVPVEDGELNIAVTGLLRVWAQNTIIDL